MNNVLRFKFFWITWVTFVSTSVSQVTVGRSDNNYDIYKPSVTTDLRAPAVPLILSDPYFSIWSPYDKLTDGSTQHWTGAAHPLTGALRVDGKVYRFMGVEKLRLQALTEPVKHWEGAYTFDKPQGDWTTVNYNDDNWKRGKAPYGTRDIRGVRTHWQTDDIWVRRLFDAEDLDDSELVLQYSHDDVFEIYLNGEKLLQTDYSWNNDASFVLSEKQKKKLVKGKNVLAAHCHNTTAGGYVDFSLSKKLDYKGFQNIAVQNAVDVLPTNTYYSFTCGPVALDLVFTAPFLPADLDLISTPVNYISYRATPLDKKEHDIQIYIETTSELAVHDIYQDVSVELIEKNNFTYLKTGTIDQPITKREGDGTRIDWGYAYLAADKSAKNQRLTTGNYYEIKEFFAQTGNLPPSKKQFIANPAANGVPALAYVDNLGKITKENPKTGFVMLGYDDIYSIEYFYKRLPAYWKHNGKTDIFQAFERTAAAYAKNMQAAREFDNALYADALKVGGKEYAELCALTYRQAIAAHKLLENENGELLFLSKENHSGGFINTVDVTYPSAPLFLIYNPDLLKGMLNGIFYYSESERWRKPYPTHDIGHYPNANGVHYGEDMPVEEAGNMILLVTAISTIEGNAAYAQKHWETLTTWANFLKEKGLDPDNQLCTDDFAGHLAHNANLSIKAILAIAGYGRMAQMLGKTDVAAEYIKEAKNMASAWQELAKDGDHYKLAFDKKGSWSQKYNIIWDKLLGMNIFPKEIAVLEIPYYLKRQAEHKYGLPLDSRKNYTKADWILWSACLADNAADFQKIVSPVYRYANETQSRVPISDFYHADNGKMENFKARSVVGGFYMKILFEKLTDPKALTGDLGDKK
ncbi:MAG: DUF4965 domain-containing protein [Dysgonamonadaceae bacterium]|jgi:hypothetical protein|nr:DUF4965 domain-containing protein [Dysgonamonadaceae bacterium]